MIVLKFKADMDKMDKPVVAKGQLNEFDPGEERKGPFTLLAGNHHNAYEVGKFDTVEDAQEEVRFLMDADPKSARQQVFTILDRYEIKVWTQDPADAHDQMRSAKKIQFLKPGKKDVDEAANPAQQAAIAVNMKKRHQKPKNEGSFDSAEYNDESGMAYNQLKSIARAVRGLADTIDEGDNLPEWVQSKLTLAEDYLVTIWDYLQGENSDEITEAADKKCPPATQNITINLKNRQKAIDEYGYGPLNPDMPNRKFWMKKVDEWNLDSVGEAKQSLCGNCAAFDVRQDTLNCIASGIDADNPEDAEGVIDAGDLGYCKFLKFKCASRRTCDAWVTGGPLTDKQDVTEARDGDTNFGSTVTRGSWVVYDGSKVKRFKSRTNAKAYAEKNGGKVASSEFYADNVQKQDVSEAHQCPECGGAAYDNEMLAEKQDACYSKVKSRYKVWPSAYASGALVRCRKVGAKNWGNKSKK
jgi:hypothetical protein